MDKHEIVTLLGGEDWSDVVATFEGMTQEQVLADVNQMFPSEDNAELAIAIYDYLK